MDRTETAQLLAMISAIYPNFKVADKTSTVDAWTRFLRDYSADDIGMALERFVATKGGGFAPSVAELIEQVYRPQELAQMSEADAWQMVRTAIGRGLYHYNDDFDAFPEAIKKAVGSAQQLRIWASSEDFNEGVESSNFYRRYKQVLGQLNEVARTPIEQRARLQELQKQSGLLEAK